MAYRINDFNFSPNHPGLQKATIIAESCHKSVSDLYGVFKTIRSAADGTTSDNEQDLLRSMLIFASAGLDATIKQIVKDVADELILKNPQALKQFQDYTKKLFVGANKRDPLENKGERVEKLLSEVLTFENPRLYLMEHMRQALIGNSLQSTRELERISSHFGIPRDAWALNIPQLTLAFNARNEIIHEMDINLESRNRNRRSRTQKDIIEYCNVLLTTTVIFITQVDEKIWIE